MSGMDLRLGKIDVGTIFRLIGLLRWLFRKVFSSYMGRNHNMLTIGAPPTGTTGLSGTIVPPDVDVLSGCPTCSRIRVLSTLGGLRSYGGRTRL